MNHRQLQAFKLVLHERSVTHAAERFGITQPAMSTMIGKLEDEVGFPLFEREKGRLRPTPEAVRFYETVEQALSSFDKVARSARDIRDLTVGRLSIASFPGISIGFLPAVISEFAKEFPDVTLSFQTRSSTQVQEWLASQMFDIGISEMPCDDPAIDVEPLSVECVCAMPEGHPLCEKEVIMPQDIASYPLITLNADHMSHFRLKQVFEDAGLPWHPQVECQLFAPACSMVVGGVGVSVVDPFTPLLFGDKGLVVRPFKPRIPFDIALLYPALRPKSLLSEQFDVMLRRALDPYVIRGL